MSPSDSTELRATQLARELNRAEIFGAFFTAHGTMIQMNMDSAAAIIDWLRRREMKCGHKLYGGTLHCGTVPCKNWINSCPVHGLDGDDGKVCTLRV